MKNETTRDRPANNPGGCECARCECIFIGEEWHTLCAVCIQMTADEIAKLAPNGVHVLVQLPTRYLARS